MNNSEEADEVLIGRYARGDAAAFDQLYRRYELGVWRYLERNVSDQATSDDLLQEIWLALARNAASLESATRFRTRLFTLAHDRMTVSLRGRSAKASPAAAAGRPAASQDPANALARALGQLPGDQRAAYLLQMEGQLSIGDIAEITESTVAAVEAHLGLARLKLHESTEEKGPSDPDSLSEVDSLYRRLSALDPGRPGEWVRRKVQAYAAQQAAERALRANATAKTSSGGSEAATPKATATATTPKQAANKQWLLPACLGAVAAAAVIGFLVLPHLTTRQDTPKAAPSPEPAPVSQSETATPQIAQSSAPASPEPEPPAQPSAPVEQSAPVSSTSSSPVPQSSAPTSPARTPVAQHPSTPPAPTVASRSAGTPPAQSPNRARVARQSAAAAQSSPIDSGRTEVTTQAARPAPPTDSAPASKIPPAPTPDTQVASATPPPPPLSPPPAPTPSAAQPAPSSATAASAPPDELWVAAKNGDMKGLQAALAGNVDVNALDPKGTTALILAIQNNHVDIVRALLAHGANPNTPDSRGYTPIRAARIRANFAIMTALENNARH